MTDSSNISRPLTLYNGSGDLIQGDLRFRAHSSGAPLVIVCHSFMAFKDWGFFPHIGSRLASTGYVTFVFNFSHNGAVPGASKIVDVEAFAKNTFSKELEDLDAVVEWFSREDNVFDGVWDPGAIFLLGHSRGGGIAILHASRDRRICGLVSLAAIATFDRWTEHQKRIWKETGSYPLARHSAVSPLRLGRRLLDDLENKGEILDIGLAASRIRCPWLILHGEVDGTVPVREAQLLFERANPEKTTLNVIPHAGHLFNAATAGEDRYVMLDAVIDAAHAWMQHHC
jgi:dienelactone hydrolase